MKPKTATNGKASAVCKGKAPGKTRAKKAAKGAKAKPKERGINARQERFAQFVASGVPATRAYRQAGYTDRNNNAEKNAVHLTENHGVKARIAELLAKNAEKSEYKRADLVNLMVLALQTAVGDVDEKHVLAQEVTTDTIGEATIRKRVKMMGKIECARLLVDIMGWKAPEQITVETGPKTLDAIKERAEKVASVLNLRARMNSAQAGSNGHSNGNGNGNGHAKPGTLSRWKPA